MASLSAFFSSLVASVQEAQYQRHVKAIKTKNAAKQHQKASSPWANVPALKPYGWTDHNTDVKA